MRRGHDDVEQLWRGAATTLIRTPLRPSLVRGGDRIGAFTLIELLVVVSIIALLISILLPSLTKARNQAKAAVCLSNLNQLGKQTALYQHDFRKLPPVRLKEADNGTGAYVTYYHNIPEHVYRRKQPRWHWFISEFIGPVVNPADYATEDAFNSATVIDNEFFECPAMTRFTNDERNGAYGYNGAYLGNSRLNSSSDGWIRWPVPESQLTHAADTVTIADSRGGSAPHGNHSYWLDPPKKAKYGDPNSPGEAFGPNPAEPLEELGHSPVETRHAGQGNVAFLDGHAARTSLKALGYHLDAAGKVVPIDQIDRTRANNRLWTGNGLDDLPGEFQGDAP